MTNSLPVAAQDPTPTQTTAPTKSARQGVLPALRSEPHPSDDRHPVAWLHITAPYRATPSATSECECGWYRHAFGQRGVITLIGEHAAHRDTCPLRNASERRNAA